MSFCDGRKNFFPIIFICPKIKLNLVILPDASLLDNFFIHMFSLHGTDSAFKAITFLIIVISVA